MLSMDTDAIRAELTHGIAVILVVALTGLCGCAHTNTQIVETQWDGGVMTHTEMSIDGWSFGGRILQRSAHTEYRGDGWTMRAGDGAKEVGADPEIVSAAVSAGGRAVLGALGIHVPAMGGAP